MPKSECVAGGTKTESLPGAHPYLNPLPNLTPAAEAKVGMFVVQETSEVFTGRWEGKAWFFFSFFKSMLLDKRWSCCRGQSDSTNYDADFCKGNRMF